MCEVGISPTVSRDSRWKSGGSELASCEGVYLESTLHSSEVGICALDVDLATGIVMERVGKDANLLLSVIHVEEQPRQPGSEVWGMSHHRYDW